MNRMGKRIAAGLCTLTLLCSLTSPVLAVEDVGSGYEAETSSEEAAEIRVNVSIFENIGRSWILNPMQITCKSGDGLEELMDILIRYAYLEDALVSGGALLSLTTDDGDVYKLDSKKEQSWLLIVNGIEYEYINGQLEMYCR